MLWNWTCAVSRASGGFVCRVVAIALLFHEWEVAAQTRNTAPTISTIASQTIDEDKVDGPLDFTVSDLETFAALLTVTAASDNTTLVPAGSISLGGKGGARNVTVTPAANQSGSALIILTVSDGSLTRVTRFFLTVNPVNDPPTTSNIDSQTIDEDSSTGAISFFIGDIDSAITSLSVTADATDKTLVPDSGIVLGVGATSPAARTITVTPVANQSGQTSITITVSDGKASSSTAFALIVNAVNDPPTINRLTTLTIDEDAGTQTVSLSGISAGPGNESQTLTITATSSDTSLIPNPGVSYTSPNSTGSLSFAPVANANGKASITVTVDDGGAANNTASVTFTVVVNPVDDPPTLDAISSLTINEDAGTQGVNLTGITSGASNESQTLTVTATSDNTGLIPNPGVSYTSPNAAGSLSFAPVSNGSGTANITVSVSDGSNTPASRTFTVTVNPVNDPPTIDRLIGLTISEDAGTQTVALSGIGSGASNESQTLAVTATSDNTGLIPNPGVSYTSPNSTGSLSFAPVANANGSVVITVTVNDGGAANNTASVAFTVVVTPVDDPPTIDVISSLTINEDAGTQTVNLTGITSGASNESQTLTVTATSDNSGLIPNPTVNYNSASATGSLSFTPASNANGSANITVSVNDSSNTPASRTFTVTVNPVNDPPTIGALSDLAINEDAGPQTVVLSGIGSGASNESQTLAVTATSDNTGLVPNPGVSYANPNATGSIGFTPIANANGAAVITVTVNDGGSANSTASTTFKVTVNPANDSPTISDILNQAVDQGSSLGPVAFTVDDIDNPIASLTVTAKSSDQILVPDASISLGGSGANRTIAIQPASGQSGAATIIVAVSDGAASAADTFVLTVNKKGSPPTIVNHPASQTADEGADVILKVDAAGDPPLAFQWRFNQRALPGELGSTLLLPAVQTSRSGNYDVVVSNQNGSITSNPGSLTVQLIEFDFGDAPEPSFPTTLKNNGARHRIVKGVFLGSLIDAEPDGKPSADALGDDGSSPTVPDDEDGVRFLTPLNAGETTKLEVFASVSGRLDAWLDFNGNGSWLETNERIFAGQALVPGANTLSFNVPADAKGGDTFARFRFSLEGVKSFDGLASDGEVEDYKVTISAQLFDFGDAPEFSTGLAAGGYPTTLARNGARHVIDPKFVLGKFIDGETDGQPSSDALGDDGISTAVPDDEDGVVFSGPLNSGATTTVIVTASQSGRLDAWIDFNSNFSWADAGEKIFTSLPLVAGANTLTFSVPASAKAGETYVRFRFSHESGLNFDGPASSGEVEDYKVTISTVSLDFGDAPEFPAGLAVGGYPTTLSRNGARHAIQPGFFLGKLIDGEPDGQPGLDALSDDGASTAVPDDEDGVVFSGPLNAGATTTVIVTASQSGRLDAWIDFNSNFSWADAGEKSFTSLPLVAGANTLAFSVPASAKAGETYARFRFSREGGLNFDGSASSGEVEDYKVTISAPLLDFGDAPQLVSNLLAGGYPTTFARNGARHVIDSKFVLGKLIDGEPDGQPSSDALGDDGASTTVPDDEDGVVFSGPLNSGATATVVVTASQSGRLDAWIDFNVNFSWADAGERIFTSLPLVAGANTLTFPVPAFAKAGETYARFRFSREGGLNFDGLASSGEVEDYKVSIKAESLDFGDAPQLQSDLLAGGYPTTLSRNGARHGINPNFFLGKLIDGELDGQPSSDALGDDGALATIPDDEDGVRFVTPLVPGREATIEVTASTTGRLDAWLDFNVNFSWADPEDHIFTSQALAPGLNLLKFLVPLRAKPGVSFARFRFSREGGLDFTGFSPIGEVEDYRVEIERGENCDLTCAGTDFWLTFPGNYDPDPANPVRPELSVVGNPGTSVSVQIPGLKFQKTTTIPAAMCVTIVLPVGADLGDANDIIEKKGIHLTASQPVSVHGLSKVKYTSDGFLAIQTEALGSDYIIQSFSNSSSPQPELNGTQFALVATENDTTVTIIPSVVTQGYDSGFPYTIKLQQGETYQLRNVNGPPQDLSGTLISSDKPVAAFGSHACANIQSASHAFCDYLVEQLIPIKRWGTDYFTFPLKTRTKGDTFRVLAAFDGTQVSINGFNVATLDRGKMFQIVLALGARITANRPIHVTQYANSSDFDLVKQSDPFMMQLPHRALFNTQYKFCAPDGFASHFINVIAPSATASAGLVQLDGAAIPPGAFFAIGVSGFSGASVPLTPGGHSVVSPQPVGLTQYGLADYESYGWPVCFFFGDTTPPVVTCPDPITVDLNKTPAIAGSVPCKTPVPDLRQKVTFTDNCPRSPNTGSVAIEPVTQEPPPGTLVGPGEHDIVLSVDDGHGNTGSCVTKFTVIGPPADPNAKPVVHCPQDIVVPCADDNGAFVDFKAFVSIGCGELPMECNPPPGLFPVGKTQVTCVYKGSSTPLTCSFTVTVNCAKIVVNHSGNTLTISWSSSEKLQVSDSLLGPWTDVPAGAQTLNVNPGDGPQKFYRIRP